MFSGHPSPLRAAVRAQTGVLSMCDDDVDECGGLEVSSRDVSVPSLMPEEPAVFTQSRGEPIAIARNLGKTSSCPQIFSHASLPTGSEQPVESQSDCVWPLVCESGSGIDRDAPNFRESSALSTCCSLLTLPPPLPQPRLSHPLWALEFTCMTPPTGFYKQ